MRGASRIPLERIAALDREVRAGRLPNATTLAALFEVSPRTIQRDIEFARDRLRMPLEFDAARNGYYYRDPGFRLPPLEITRIEAVAVLLAERVLQQYRGLPFAAELAAAFGRMTLGLAGTVTVDLRHLGEALSFRTTAACELDPELFEQLHQAIAQRRRLRLSYFSATSGCETTRNVDPYHLASLNGQWYLIGHCHTRAAVLMFVPMRIRRVDVTNERFDVPEGFNLDAYLRDSLGVMRGDGGPPRLVRLRFTGDAVRYVRERTWHPSQRVEHDAEDVLVLTLSLSHMLEVKRWALQWGDECEVLDPLDLRMEVAETLRRAERAYLRSAASAETRLNQKEKNYGRRRG